MPRMTARGWLLGLLSLALPTLGESVEEKVSRVCASEHEQRLEETAELLRPPTPLSDAQKSIVLRCRGFSLFFTGSREQARLALEESERIARTIERLDLVQLTLAVRALTLHQEGELGEAMRMYFESLELSEVAADSIGASGVAANIAWLLTGLGAYETSLYFIERAELADPDPTGLRSHPRRISRADCLSRLGRIDEADRAFAELDADEEIRRSDRSFRSLLYVHGLHENRRPDFERALDYFEQALPLFPKAEWRRVSAGMARSYLGMGDIALAEDVARVTELVNHRQDPLTRIEFLLVLRDIAEAKGDFATALRHANAIDEDRTRIQTSLANVSPQGLLQRISSSQSRAQVRVLEQRQEIESLRAASAAARRRQGLLLASIGLLMVGGVMAQELRRRRELVERQRAFGQELEQRLDEREAELATVFQDRLSIERELHAAQRGVLIQHLLRGIAHDFSNLVSVLNINASLGLRALQEASAEDAAVAFEVIQQGSDHCLELSRKISGLVGQTNPEPKNTSPAAHLPNLVGFLEGSLPPGVTMRYEADPGIQDVAVALDPVELDQIVLNLWINAREVLGEHGTIELRLRAFEHRPESVCAACGEKVEGDLLEIVCMDDGPGFSDAVKIDAFEAFVTTKKGTGGLGLSVISALCHRARGHVLLMQSNLGGAAVSALLSGAERLPRRDDDAGLARISQPVVP